MQCPRITMAFALLVCTLFSSRANAQAKAHIRIAAFVPLSGPLAPYGEGMLQGMNLVLAQLKVADPDLASRITLLSKDTQKNSPDIEKLAQQAVSADKADMFIGALTSSTTFMLASAAESLKRPLISPIVTHNGLTQKNPMAFRSVYKDSDQGDVLAQYTLKNLNKTSAALVLEAGSEAANALAQQFEKSFVAGGGQVVAKVEYVPGAGGLRRVLDKVRAAKAQVIICPGFYNDVGKLMDEASEMGLRYPILGGDGWDSPQLFQVTSKNGVRGHYFVTPFSLADTDKPTTDFVAAFKKAYNRDPDMLAALSYDAMALAIDSFKRANSHAPDSLVRALSTAKDVSGALGPLTINANRDAQRQAIILKTTPEGGKFAAKIAPAL